MTEWYDEPEEDLYDRPWEMDPERHEDTLASRWESVTDWPASSVGHHVMVHRIVGAHVGRVWVARCVEPFCGWATPPQNREQAVRFGDRHGYCTVSAA